MDARSVVMAQIEVVNRNLATAKKLLGQLKIDPSLSKGVRGSLSKEIQSNRAELQQLREEVKDGQALDGCWDRFRDIRQQCERVFRECLAFVQGSLLRSAKLDGAKLDNGLCEIADALLVYLGGQAVISWDRFTMLAEEEFFVGMAQIIRLRFLDLSIWTLPIAAHEFGHFIGPEIKERGVDGKFHHPFEDKLQQEKEKEEKRWSYLHEHFADLFATYALGPAFACACILLRFDPRTAYEDKSKHPSDAKRAYLILRMLDKMSNTGEKELIPSPFQFLSTQLSTLWKDSLVGAKRKERLDNAETFPLDDLLEDMYLLLKANVPDVRYGSWLQAETLATQLQPDNDEPLKIDNDVTLPDALNAAWYVRLQHWGEDIYVLRRIEERAIGLCFGIAH